jgi:nucleoside-diphosphate-sugar epimerase
MSSALIGYTGFVGGNLLRQVCFDELYNSKNIEAIAGREFHLIVCAGAPAVKWFANKEPLTDLKSINRLRDCLGQASAQKVILISTVDVYPSPIEVDEETSIDINQLHPYGKHRLELERFVQDNFDTTIIRLPGLFGKGLKKNIIYDFLHNNDVEKIHKDSAFQFYSLEHLWRDIEACLKQDIKLINFATEPTRVQEVAHEGFGFEFTNEPNYPPARYDFRTKYGSIFGSPTPYLYSKKQIFQDLKDFVRKQTETKREMQL